MEESHVTWLPLPGPCGAGRGHRRQLPWELPVGVRRQSMTGVNSLCSQLSGTERKTNSLEVLFSQPTVTSTHLGCWVPGVRDMLMKQSILTESPYARALLALQSSVRGGSTTVSPTEQMRTPSRDKTLAQGHSQSQKALILRKSQ